mmetsp:Transcript_41407/g.96810  ORF Transcript_41407/g.96810 Transcript_41407/m.96810 type:complete len:244 (-) Transcript_41407:659-1390(-)
MRSVVDDCKPHPPLPVLCELRDGGQQRLREQLDADDTVDRVQRRDDVQPHLRELVAQKLQEEGQQLLDGDRGAHERGEAHDGGGERSAHVLRRVGRQLAHARDDVRGHELAAEHLREARHLESDRRANLRLLVVNHAHEGREHLVLRLLRPDGGHELAEVLAHDVPHAPRAVVGERANDWQQRGLVLWDGEQRAHAYAVLDGEKPYRVLIIGRERFKERQPVCLEVLYLARGVDGGRQLPKIG